MPFKRAKTPFLKGLHYLSGNEASAEGAIAGGCRFYAGYPITPSSELMERISVRLRDVGGVFIQMEDEIASISAVIGASWAGAKAMTATPGPGFSLMQESIGYAAFTETPCITRDEKSGEVLIDLDYCKGCGICASVCPKGAIQMVLEEGI